MDAIVRLKELVSNIETLENFRNIYPLNSDQEIELREYKKELYQTIKKL